MIPTPALLPQQDDKASAMTFYSKLMKELRKQFKTSDIPISETRAKLKREG
jgi:hypothetical protein